MCYYFHQVVVIGAYDTLSLYYHFAPKIHDLQIVHVGEEAYGILALDITPGHNPQVRIPRSVARPDKTHKITHRRLES